MKDFVDGTAFKSEQGNRARKLFAAVVLAALDDAISDDKKYGNGPEQIARWARSRDGREVLTCAGNRPERACRFGADGICLERGAHIRGPLARGKRTPQCGRSGRSCLKNRSQNGFRKPCLSAGLFVFAAPTLTGSIRDCHRTFAYYVCSQPRAMPTRTSIRILDLSHAFDAWYLREYYREAGFRCLLMNRSTSCNCRKTPVGDDCRCRPFSHRYAATLS